MRKRDVVLMATVTSFDALAKPSRTEMRQFAELFRPLYEQSTDEARRQAVAALSRLTELPQSVCFFVGCQPINIAAIFLSHSPAIADKTLIEIARSQSEAHARAIATRATLSPMVVDALAALHDGSSYRRRSDVLLRDATEPVEATPAEAPIKVEAEQPEADPRELARLAREEALRNELRQMARGAEPQKEGADHEAPIILRAADEVQNALFVRFARARQMPLFARVLSDALDASSALAERILLDVSGAQLATTLIALGCRPADIRTMLTAIYPHLAQISDGRNRAYTLVRSLEPSECVARVIAWRRADIYTRSGKFEDVEADIAAKAAEAAANGNRGSETMRRAAGARG